MMWVLGFALATVGISIVAIFGMAQLKARQTARSAAERVQAYATTIRRTAKPAHLNAMSDTELYDILLAAAKKQQTHQSNRSWITFVAALATLAIAIYFATSSGFTGFAVTLTIGAIAIFGVNQVLKRQLASWFSQNELEPDRLRLD